jgi:hypothetical protein
MCVCVVIYIITCMCMYVYLLEGVPFQKGTQALIYTSMCACVLNSCLLRGQDGDSNSATASQTNLQAARAICGIRKQL